MKYDNLKDKINALIEQSEKSNELVKKRTESIAKLKKMVEDNDVLVKELKQKHNREYYYNREKMVQLREELTKTKDERDRYALRFKELENSFNTHFEEYKQRLNSHYYVLQKAFNDYVKGKTKDNDRQDRLESSNKEILGRITALEHKMLEMFFEGDCLNEEQAQEAGRAL